MSMKTKFLRLISVIDKNNKLILGCDYNSPFGNILRESVERGWVTIESTTLLEYHTPEGVRELARHKYELELTEEGKVLYDFHKL